MMTTEPISTEYEIKNAALGPQRPRHNALVTFSQPEPDEVLSMREFVVVPPSGFLSPKVDKERLLKFTRDDIKAPLTKLDKRLHKISCKCFRMIQRIMEDRKYPLTQRRSTQPEKRDMDFHTIQRLLNIGLQEPLMRDELFLQVFRQLQENPTFVSNLKGWEIMCVFSNTFPPSKALARALEREFSQDRLTRLSQPAITTRNSQFNAEDAYMGPVRISMMKNFVITNLQRLSKTGPRGILPSKELIESIIGLPFSHQVFGVTLSEVMIHPENQDPSQLYPRILSFLAEGILKLNGQNTEGIFRIPGDHEQVQKLRLRIEKGEYKLEGITDPHIPASLLRQWLRELAEPVIPPQLYLQCLQVSNLEAALVIIRTLPDINRDVLSYLIKFLQFIGNAEFQSKSKMNYANLSMVFAPSILRCPSDDPLIILAHSRLEQNFVKILLDFY